jgi:hypothetical protein
VETLATATVSALLLRKPCLVTASYLIKFLPGRQQLHFAYALHFKQIPDDRHQVAVSFRRANGISDGDS